MKTLLISLHPRHSRNILSGEKTIELRKNPVRQTFSYILFYETLPTAAIVGYCSSGEVIRLDAQTFCDNHQSNLCLSSREIWDYLGTKMGYGIQIRNPQKLAPIPLAKMRETGILPPQGFRYLTNADLEKLGVKYE